MAKCYWLSNMGENKRKTCVVSLQLFSSIWNYLKMKKNQGLKQSRYTYAHSQLFCFIAQHIKSEDHTHDKLSNTKFFPYKMATEFYCQFSYAIYKINKYTVNIEKFLRTSHESRHAYICFYSFCVHVTCFGKLIELTFV